MAALLTRCRLFGNLDECVSQGALPRPANSEGQCLGACVCLGGGPRQCPRVTIYSRIFVTLPFRTVTSKTQSSLNPVYS